jgi:predicted RNA binding protein YcfA (HicA-like mRNA interferase family)
MSVRRHCLGLVLLAAIAAGAVLAVSAIVRAQDHSHMDHGHHMQGADAVVPAHPGQEAFGTIQEIVRILEADPNTDWSKVNIAGLREHLIDMDDVTMRAKARERALDNGIEIAITGEGRTVGAIKRMVPAHARELVALGWNAGTQDLPDGVKLVVTTRDPSEAVKLKALGFLGIMVQGAHHQPHHLMMAKGEFEHGH